MERGKKKKKMAGNIIMKKRKRRNFQNLDQYQSPLQYHQFFHLFRNSQNNLPVNQRLDPQINQMIMASTP
jgi:hypothetical protein